MGIFDDAIRQHLDLKRRLGADESELQQLEDEAFGLPARPGDPDFPETGESAADGEASAEALPESAEQAEPAPEAEKAEAPPEAEPVAAEPLAEADAPVVEPSDESPPHGDALLADPEAEPAETPPAADAPVEDTGAPGFTTTEREAIANQPTEFFDHAPEPLELGELDLDLKDELDEVATLGDEPATGEEPVEEPTPVDEAQAIDEPTPVDELEVVEDEEPASEEAELAPEPDAEPGAEEDAEDVLEETPEFLRDNPDDDELWFEQGKPKDFDF